MYNNKIIQDEFLSGLHPKRPEGEDWAKFLGRVYNRGYEQGIMEVNKLIDEEIKFAQKNYDLADHPKTYNENNKVWFGSQLEILYKLKEAL